MDDEKNADVRDLMPPAQRYGIVVTATRVFNRQLPKQGNIFYVATFNLRRHGIQEVFQVSYANIQAHGEKACKDAVIQQVVTKYFTK